MIRVTHRAGRNTYVSGGCCLTTLLYMFFVLPIIGTVWVTYLVFWGIWQLAKLVNSLVNARMNSARR